MADHKAQRKRRVNSGAKVLVIVPARGSKPARPTAERACGIAESCGNAWGRCRRHHHEGPSRTSFTFGYRYVPTLAEARGSEKERGASRMNSQPQPLEDDSCMAR
eukprot:778863-Rhodomonas_salina.2